MQCFVNPVGQLSIDPGDACQFFHAGLAHTLQPAKMGQQCATAACTDALDVFQY